MSKQTPLQYGLQERQVDHVQQQQAQDGQKSPHSSSIGRKISGTTMRILRLGGGLMVQVHSTLAG
ncbi:hypothetical protein EYF80_003086 [Liparis tanakae]|uniref:Uncharacterized protein n=1 Tax=Liparis tanakae TaxID=230148 RepID=A0A4Z2JAC0_9TELE|nr:hypothetical protein EYF80_003086 [Liparis tanakae]